MSVRVVLADDHPLFRDGIASLLRARGFEIVGEANNGREALELIRRTHPDLVLMDIHMPELDGLATTRILTSEMPEVRVVILTVSDDDNDVFEAIKSGAQGYLLKNSDTRAFFDLIEGAARGETPLSGRLASRILREFAKHMNRETVEMSNEDALSEREKEVLTLAAEGLTNREIAARVNLSENTIKYHFKNILEKLHLRNRAQAVVFAVQSGLLKPKD
ncbi:MAG: Transcriptional regulatory protein DegU [Anaerolineae bacterium]|nr:Transcriptional regulatory protein DegU [Anaerolineae bacterium]MDL1895486.1 response regulator transcription factor [Anaerolineae bacterium CFX7]RIK32881.1 MAG: DNA-binding response regulator [Chloroflexota bacterium]